MSEFQISKSGFGISNSKLPCVQFSQNEQLLNLWKLPNYLRYFGNTEDVADSWVEAEMSWVEVDGAGCMV